MLSEECREFMTMVIDNQKDLQNLRLKGTTTQKNWKTYGQYNIKCHLLNDTDVGVKCQRCYDWFWYPFSQRRGY